ncbi:aminopeptidase, partial [Halobellus sp. Atlit-31R]
GFQLDALRAQAERRDFRPVDLKVAAKVALKSAIRMVEQYNVVGIVPGLDPKLKEQAVVYSSHWDHMGIDETAQPGKQDRIYNGAIDNASGTAALLAMAQEAVRHPAKRSQMFLWVAAEEQGLLGSAAYASKPLWPIEKTVANLNLDSLNFVGLVKD